MGLSTALMNRDAARDASREQSRATDAAIAEQRRQFDLIREDQAPWQATGRAALNQLAGLFGLDTGTSANEPQIDPRTGLPMERLENAPGTPDYSSFFESPDYRYALEQGQQMVERSAAARGNLNSGGTLAALTRLGQGLASQNYGNYVNRLASLSGVGQTANSALGEAGLNTSGNISNLLYQRGADRASGILGAQAATNQSMGNTMNFLAGMWGRGGGRAGGGATNTTGYGNYGSLTNTAPGSLV